MHEFSENAPFVKDTMRDVLSLQRQERPKEGQIYMFYSLFDWQFSFDELLMNSLSEAVGLMYLNYQRFTVYVTWFIHPSIISLIYVPILVFIDLFPSKLLLIIL